MKKVALVAALGLGVAACSDAPVAPISTLAPAPAAFARAGAVPIPGRYIVRFSDNENNVDGQVNQLSRRHGGRVTNVYRSAIKGMAIELSDRQVAALRADPAVVAMEQDQTVSISTTQTGATWGIDRIDQRTLPLSSTYVYNADGTGVTVYIIDTGMNLSHTEYTGRARTGYDAVTAGGTAADCNGHGTHVAGTVGGTTYGVAKKISLVAIRVLDCAGSGTISGVIAGIDWVTANKVLPAAANMSLGGGASAALNTAVANSVKAGVVYAVAAGNDARDACLYSPASEATAITVGATDIDDAFASFSNRGSCVDINAPGVNITSSWYNTNTATNTISGTSMATPHVAGAIALYLQANPLSTPAQVDAAFKANASSTTVPAGTTNKFLYTGYITAAPSTAPPVADFTSSCTNLNCTFDGSSSTARAGATYSWNFGDATPNGSGVTTTHGYGAAGTYSVTLTVTDVNGTSSRTKPVTVTAAPPPPAGPVANYTYSCTGLTCRFTNSSTGATAYSWAFGDNTSSTAASPTKTYARAGSYTVVLTARNGTLSSTKSQVVTVTAPPACVDGDGDC